MKLIPDTSHAGIQALHSLSTCDPCLFLSIRSTQSLHFSQNSFFLILAHADLSLTAIDIVTYQRWMIVTAGGDVNLDLRMPLCKTFEQRRF